MALEPARRPDRVGNEAGTAPGPDEIDRLTAFLASVLAKSNKAGPGLPFPFALDGLRLGIGAVLVYEVPKLVRVGRLVSADFRALKGRGTHTSRPTPPRPKDDSPVAPNFPLPSRPVVELLILLAFGAEPVDDAVLPEGATGGLVAERTDVG